ncbi:MAG: insulinase family protein [Bacteroidaceae bacterium]|nr:insulinase family protein [Bacteroidaceae bacterium]
MITVNRHTLANGLRVVHNEDRSTQMVAINVLYDVGARDEEESRTGFAHLFEHLMFGGSVHIPDYDTPVQEAGGENNAWTTNDLTNYYLTLPKQNVEVGFWLESDRMLGLAFSQESLDVQRMVVMEEFKQRHLNQPYGDASHLIRALAYTTHPYRWPTIGLELAHIAQATLEDVKDFFYRFYAPNNAILSIAGNISFDETIRLVEKWFGPIPRREVHPRMLPQEPKQTEIRRMTVERDVPLDTLYMAFHTCNRTHPDYYAVDMLSDLLANGSSSRLIEHLVKQKQIFSQIDAYITGSFDEGLLKITGKPLPGISLEESEAYIWQELETLCQTMPEEKELEKVKNRYEAEQTIKSVNFLNNAVNMAYFELIGQAEDVNDEVRNYHSVTPQDIQRVANKVFKEENSSVLYYKAVSQ